MRSSLPARPMVTRAPILTGQRVILRPYAAGFSEDEILALYRWGRDPSLLALSGGSPLDMPYDRFRDIFLSQLPRRNAEQEQLFALLNDDAVMIGRVGLFGLTADDRAAELGIVIGERDAWNQGYGRDAVRTISRYAFEVLFIDRIYLFTFVDNRRAQRAFRACGFAPVRRVRRFSFDRGIQTELEMELLSPAP